MPKYYWVKWKKMIKLFFILPKKIFFGMKWSRSLGRLDLVGLDHWMCCQSWKEMQLLHFPIWSNCTFLCFQLQRPTSAPPSSCIVNAHIQFNAVTLRLNLGDLVADVDVGSEKWKYGKSINQSDSLSNQPYLLKLAHIYPVPNTIIYLSA